jgi:hypothetical protein
LTSAGRFKWVNNSPCNINPNRMDFKPMQTVSPDVSCRRCGGRLELRRA